MYKQRYYLILSILIVIFCFAVNINAQSSEANQKEFVRLMNQNKWSQAKNGFRYPSFMKHQYIEDVDNSIFNAEVYSWNSVQIVNVGYLGAWSLIGEGYPTVNETIAYNITIKNMTYWRERNGIYSGYTTDGRIFYMKTILYPSGDPNFVGGMGTLTVIYPKSYQQSVEPIIDIVQHWKPKKLRTD